MSQTDLAESSRNLTEYYLDQGLEPGQFWIGPEHPGLEELALQLLDRHESMSVLEIGHQAGGFAVPLILALHGAPGFQYTGIDNLSYANSVSGELIAKFLTDSGVPADKFRFLVVSDAREFLMTCQTRFDLILVDHLKSLYPRDLEIIMVRDLLVEGGSVVLHDVTDKSGRILATVHQLMQALRLLMENPPRGTFGRGRRA